MKTAMYIGPFQLPDKNAAAQRVLNNAKALRVLGYDTIFVGLNPDANAEFEKTKYEYDGFKIYELRCSGAIDKIKKFSSFEWFEKLLLQYDIAAVIAYDYYALGLYRIKCLCNKRGLPIIADTDEWFAATGRTLPERIIRKVDSEVRMRFLQPKLDGVIAISEFLYKYYSAKTLTVKIPPLVDKSEIKWKIKSEATDNDVLKIVYSGSPGTSKDKINKVVEYLANIDTAYEIKLDVIGITMQQFLEVYPECESMLKKNSKQITFMGRLAHKEALSLLQKADFSMFLRDDNRVTKAGFPTKFVESISAGVPVITNGTSNIADYLKNGQNGFLLGENIGCELEKILQSDFLYLKEIKQKVDSDIFDYNNFLCSFSKIVDVIEKTNE